MFRAFFKSFLNDLHANCLFFVQSVCVLRQKGAQKVIIKREKSLKQLTLLHRRVGQEVVCYLRKPQVSFAQATLLRTIQ